MNLLSRRVDARETATPAATMRTLASASWGPDLPVAVWWTELPGGSRGPEHVIDVDHFLVVAAGSVDVELQGSRYRLGAGDGLKLPAGAVRVIAASEDAPATTLTIGGGGGTARVGEGDRVVVPWSA